MAVDVNPARPQRTPAIVWILALLVVAAVWFFWSGARREETSDLARWNRETLSIEEVVAILEQPSPSDERLGHALVQLQSHAAADAAAMEGLGGLARHLERHAGRDDSQLRSLVAMGATFLGSPESIDLLRRMLGDPDGKVTLNAAIGLAAHDDPAGADRLEEALRGTRIEQTEVRRNLLHAFRRVAQKRHEGLLRSELHRAELDRDEDAASYCREALDRLE